MSQTSPEAASRSNYQAIFDSALEAYKKKTGKDLTTDPLLCSFETCDSPDAILAILRVQTLGPGQFQNGADKLLTWLNPTINVLNAFSAAIGGTVGQVYQPVGVIFTGIGILLSAANAVSTSRDLLLGLFERIENIFRRLEIYIEVPRTSGMMDVIVKVMVEILCILSIATKEINQHRAKTFLKKLVGRTDIEDALQRLEVVTLEEARMAAAESLKAIHGVGTNVQDTLKAMEDRMRGLEGMLQGVGNRLQGVDDRGKNIDEKAISSPEKTALQDIGARIIDGSEAISGPITSDFVDSSRNQLRQDSIEWLSPPNPAVNYSVARNTHHTGTSMWFTESGTFRDWKECGSLLWIHGKPGSGKSVLTSVIIQDIEHISDTGSAYMAYFFFDFKDYRKQDARALLSSVLVQLSRQSVSFNNVLLEFYLLHQRGSKQPSDSALLQCLEKMLRIPGKVPIYLIIDALDECSDNSGVQSPREKVLRLFEKLVRFHLPNLRLCVTSRTEVGIRNVLEPLTSRRNRISLHDEDGQKKGIADYVSSVFCSDVMTMRWREEDKKLVISALSDRNGGVFLWVSCQIGALRRCLAPSVRPVVQELPENLEETYERIIQGIPKANRVHAHRLLQCLTVAARPLHVQELAEVLAVDLSAAGGVPKLNEDWRWDDQEQAVLTACSGLITVIDDQASRMVQFSHSSVRDFLTSDRLATAEVDTLRYYHIRPEPAHTIISQACISVLLRLEYPVDSKCLKRFPLADYAAKHFAHHAEFGDVISQITDGIDNLLDEEKPHFGAWMSLLSSSLVENHPRLETSPLYHLAGLGYHGLVHHLLSRRPQDTIVRSGILGLSAHAALNQRHIQVCQLLLPHCISVDVRNSDGQTPLHVAARHGHLEAARMIIGQGADMNARDNNGWTPLQEATFRGYFDVTQLLLEHGASVHARNKDGWTPLHEASRYGYLDIIQPLLEHGADRNAMNDNYCTPLHLAAAHGQLAATKFLVEQGAITHVPNKDGWTPLHEAAFHGYPDVMRPLLEHGASVHVRNKDGWTPLHEASCYGYLSIIQLLLEHGADRNAMNDDHCTPLHLAAARGQLAATRLLVEQGVNIDVPNKNGRTPLYQAAFHGHLETVRFLLEHGASVHVQNKDGWTPLHEASFYGYLDVVRLLLDHDADRDAVDHIYRTPLHLTASRGQLAASRLLVEQGAVINARNINDWTPLHEATFHGHLSIVRFLLEHGASVHVQNKDGWSLLHEASCYGYLNILRLLLEHGADLNAANHNYCTPLHLAAAKGQLAATRLLVEQGATTGVPNKDGWTPLYEATFHRRADIVQFLLEHDASVHIANKDGWTPLHDASCYGYTDIIRLLLKHGANLEATNNERNTPLHLAANKGQLSATQLLVENGAVVGAQNKNGWTPLHEASVHGHSDVILFLLDHTTNGRAGQQARNTAV